jgi:hypothetical protein
MLTDSEIRKSFAKDRDFKLSDSGGLFLLIRCTGQRGWRYSSSAGPFGLLPSPGTGELEA